MNRLRILFTRLALVIGLVLVALVVSAQSMMAFTGSASKGPSVNNICVDATGTQTGCVNTGTQTFAGAKTFNSAITDAAATNAFICSDTGTCGIQSNISAANATASVGAFTLTPAIALDADDLIFEINNSDGLRRASVDAEGDFSAVGDFSMRGTLTTSNATVSMIFSSTTNATTASTTVAAYTLTPTTALDVNDLVVRVTSSTPTNLMTVDLEGDTTITGAVTSAAAAPQWLCSATGTCTIQSGISAATASTTVAAYTLAPSTALDANDLLLNVEDSVGTNLFTVDLEGDGALTTTTLSGAAPQLIASAAGTMTLRSGITALNATGAVAAYTLAGLNVLDNLDLVFNIQDNATDLNNIFIVDENGNIGFGTNSGSTIQGRGTTTMTFLRADRTALSTTSGSAALELGTVLTLDANDLVVGVLEAGAYVWQVDAEGDTTVLGAFSTGVAAPQYISTALGTMTLQSAISAVNASTTVAAYTLAPTTALDANDLLLNVENSVGTNIATIDVEGDMAVTTLAASSTGGNPAGLSIPTGGYFSFAGVNEASGMALRASGSADLIVSSSSTNYFQFNTGAAGSRNFVASQSGTTLGTSANGNWSTAFVDDITASIATSTMQLTSPTNDATTSATVASITLAASADITAADLVLNVEDSVGTNLFTVTEAGTATAIAYVATRATLASVYINGVTLAATNYGGDVLPAQAFTVAQVTFRISTAGSGGTTSFAFRISDGTNICDCTLACNSAGSTNYNTTCAGAGGSGCALPASANLTYSVNSIGDCTVGPTILGTVQVRGTWQ